MGRVVVGGPSGASFCVTFSSSGPALTAPRESGGTLRSGDSGGAMADGSLSDFSSVLDALLGLASRDAEPERSRLGLSALPSGLITGSKRVGGEKLI